MHLTSYVDCLYSYAISLSRDPENAKDLVQDTYVRALQAEGRLRPDSNLKSWLFTILRNLWFNQLRQKRNGPVLIQFESGNEAGDVSPDDSGNSLDICIAKTEQEEMRNAIRALPSEFREVILLREYEYLSYEEIGAILDCPMGTVMSRLSRARGKLKHTVRSMRASDRD